MTDQRMFVKTNILSNLRKGFSNISSNDFLLFSSDFIALSSSSSPEMLTPFIDAIVLSIYLALSSLPLDINHRRDSGINLKLIDFIILMI